MAPRCFVCWGEYVSQDIKSFGEFKKYLRKDDISVPPYFYIGNRNEQVIHCKMRIGMSDLQNDLFNRHLSDRKNCEFGATKETALHYLLHCPQHTRTRHTTIFNLPPIARQAILFPFVISMFLLIYLLLFLIN